MLCFPTIQPRNHGAPMENQENLNESTRVGHQQPKKRPWTLVEVVVYVLVFGFILSCFVIPIAGPVLSPAQATNRVIRVCVYAWDEFEIAGGTLPDHRSSHQSVWPRNALGASGVGTPDDAIERFVCAVLEVEGSRKMILSCGSPFVVDSDGDGFLEVRDGWGRLIQYVAAVSHQDSFTADDFLPERKVGYFVSFGYDGVPDSVATKYGKASGDDLYSFDE